MRNSFKHIYCCNLLGPLIAFGFLVSNGAYGQLFKKMKAEEAKFGFHLQNKKGFYALPFQVRSNLIVVPVLIDNSDTLNFILDTGVSSIFITDPELADKMGLEYSRYVSILGVGEEKEIKAGVSINHHFRAGDINAYQQNLVVLSEDILHLSEFMGIPIHGIFGHSLFENLVVSIDFNSLFISVSSQDRFKFRSRKYGEKYPIMVTGSVPYTDAFSLAENNENEKPVRLVIDTGAGHALLLSSENGDIGLPEKVIRANLGRGLNGEIYGNIGRVSKLSIGKHEVKDIIASFPDSLSFSMKFPPSEENRQGSIGGEFLRRFKVTFNYHEGYMALKPNKKRMRQPFEYNMSGLDVRAFSESYNRFYIKEVLEDSPAYRAGLQANDEIIFLNNQHVNTYQINDIIKLLSKKEGRKIEIFYRRRNNGTLGFATFRLQRAI